MMHERFRSPSPAGMGALRGVLDTVPVGIAIFGPDGSPRLVNRAARDILGDLASAPLARWVDQRRITRPDGTPMELEDLPPWAALQDGRPRREVDICIRRPAGIRFPVLVSADAVRDAEDNILQVACSLTAIEAWRQRADAARRAVKMEAIGTLAASLAGPFNDTLTAISGYCDLASSRLDRSDPVRHVVAEIQQAGDRAAMLTGRLLAHAEREVPVPQVLELDAWLTSHVTTLRSLVGDHLRLEVHPDAEGVAIRVDPHLLEQVLSDLIANARQAMGEEGALRLATSRIELDPDLAALLGAGCAGPHGVLSIHDSGGGMEERILPKIFEPFFTTKPGALGLGLTTVDRLVRSQGGHVRVESRWGEGSTFHVHFPLVESPGKAAADAPSSGEMPEPGPRRRVLLVEDDAVVRDLVREVLEMLHFHVLEARSGTEGLEIAEARTEPLDLLISDIVLPGITGDTLARRIRARQPHLPVLLMSGCSDGDLLARALEDETTAFLPKPFAPEALRAKIRDVLGPAVSTARSEADQADQADEVENAPVAPIHLGRSDDLEGDFDEGIETLEHIEAGGGA